MATQETSLVTTEASKTERAALWVASGLCGKQLTENLRTSMRRRRTRMAADKLFRETNERRRNEFMPELSFSEWTLIRLLELKLTRPDSQVSQESKYAIADLINSLERTLLERKVIRELHGTCPF